MKYFNSLTLFTFLILSFLGHSQTNPDFYLAENGVTCMCPDADFGDSGTLIINGVEQTFTKRTRVQLDAIIVNDQQDPEIAMTCTSGITSMADLFNQKQTFNQDISHWDVSNVNNMSDMFHRAYQFNQPLNNWDVSNVTDMSGMFRTAFVFNQSIDNWDVSNVIDMSYMFFNDLRPNHTGPIISFNQPLNNWDVSNVTNMHSMFFRAYQFNQPLNNWDVSNVTDMGWMFHFAESFDQPLDNWDVSNVTDMSVMFSYTDAFNQPLNNWDVSNVTDMNRMFRYADAFNQPLNNWDISNVTRMDQMFREATNFNQDISIWSFNEDVVLSTFLSNSGLDQENYDLLLISFDNQNLQNKTFGADGLEYCNTEARDNLIDNKGWTINGDALSENCITCEAPTNLEVLEVFETTAEISFESIQIGSANVLVMNQGDVIDVNTPVQDYQINGFQAGVNTFFQLDLEPNTAYDIYIRFNCGMDDFSEYVGPLSFQTQCEKPDLPIADTTQTFCSEPSLEDVSVTGQNLEFYEDSNLTTNIPSNASLTNEQIIYATQTIDNCESEALAVEIIIDDSTAPIADVQNLPSLEAQCEVTSLTPPTATDNCDGEIIGITNAVLPITETETITWTFEDSSGNISTQNQVVLLEDVEAPLPDNSQLGIYEAGCNFELSTLPRPTATDNCEGSITAVLHSLSFPPGYETMLVTWRYSDVSGNFIDQTQLISTVDGEAPVPELESLPELTSQCSITSLTPPTATDNCDNSVLVGTTDVVLPVTETTTIEWVFEDSAGNSTTQSQTIVVEDTESPEILAESEVNLDLLDGFANLSVEMIDNGSSDNCSLESQVLSQVSFSCDDLENQPLTISYTLTDSSGNSSSQDILVNITDSLDSCETLSVVNPTREQLAIKLYPNPASHQVTLSSDHQADFKAVSLYNMLGQKVKHLELSGSAEPIQIDVAELAAGNYFIQITTKDQQQITKRFIKH